MSVVTLEHAPVGERAGARVNRDKTMAALDSMLHFHDILKKNPALEPLLVTLAEKEERLASIFTIFKRRSLAAEIEEINQKLLAAGYDRPKHEEAKSFFQYAILDRRILKVPPEYVEDLKKAGLTSEAKKLKKKLQQL